MKKLSIFMLAGLLVLSLLICGCDEAEDQNALIDNNVEANDLFGDDFGAESEDAELNDVETTVESDNDTEAETAE